MIWLDQEQGGHHKGLKSIFFLLLFSHVVVQRFAISRYDEFTKTVS